MRPCTVWLDFETCSRARHGDPRGVVDAPGTTKPHLCCNKVHLQFPLYWQALVRTRHHWKRPRRDIHVANTWMSVRFHDRLWRGVRSLCRCLLFAVLPTNSFKHPHVPCPRTGQRSCFAKVLSSILYFLVLVTRSEVLRDGSRHPLPARTGSHARFKSDLLVAPSAGCFPDVWMHDVCSFSDCQRSVEQTAFHCSAQVSVSILDPLVWNSALPQVGSEFCAIVIAIGR